MINGTFYLVSPPHFPVCYPRWDDGSCGGSSSGWFESGSGDGAVERMDKVTSKLDARSLFNFLPQPTDETPKLTGPNEFQSVGEGKGKGCGCRC